MFGHYLTQLQADRGLARAAGSTAAGRAAGTAGRSTDPIYLRGPFPDAAVPRARRADRLRRAGRERSDLSLPRHASAASTDIDLRLERGSFTVITGRIGAARRRCCGCCSVCCRSRRARSAGTARGRRPGELLRPAALRLHAAGAAPVQRDAARQHPARPAGGRGGSARRPSRGRAGARHRRAWRMGWTRWSGRAACGSPAARSSAPPPRACSCATPELLVFDDLSSALDVETERMLWERLAGRDAHLPGGLPPPGRRCGAPTTSSC